MRVNRLFWLPFVQDLIPEARHAWWALSLAKQSSMGLKSGL